MPHGRSPDVHVTGGMAMVNLAPVVPASEAQANLVSGEDLPQSAALRAALGRQCWSGVRSEA